VGGHVGNSLIITRCSYFDCVQTQGHLDSGIKKERGKEGKRGERGMKAKLVVYSIRQKPLHTLSITATLILYTFVLILPPPRGQQPPHT
jgi:hypothetical protein